MAARVKRRDAGTESAAAPRGAAGFTSLLVADDDAAMAPAAMDPNGIPVADRLRLGCMTETNGGSSLEAVPGFDRSRGLQQGLFPTARKRPPAPAACNRFRVENIIGDTDERVAVPDPTQLPWRCIAMLSITYETGATAMGTGFFIGPKLLATAGHNIRDPRSGARATQILVSPGFNGTMSFPRTVPAVRTFADPRWLAGDDNPELDWGLVFLADDTIGRRLGWFGIGSFTPAQLVPMAVNVSGYPADRTPLTQYFNGGRIERIESSFLLYSFDTSEGMSGAPVFALFDKQRVVVGIHTSGNDRLNRARRVDQMLFDTIAPHIEV